MANGNPQDERFMLTRIEELDKRVSLTFDMMQKSIDRSSTELNLRLIGMNEFRNQLKDQVGTFVTREQWASLQERLETRVSDLEQTNANVAGRFWAMGVFATLAGGLLGTLLAVLFRTLHIP